MILQKYKYWTKSRFYLNLNQIEARSLIILQKADAVIEQVIIEVFVQVQQHQHVHIIHLHFNQISHC